MIVARAISSTLLAASCAAVLGATEGPPPGAPMPAPAATQGRKYPPRIYTTVRLQAQPPVVDGRLDDDAWREGTWAGDYRQQLPTEGAQPSQPTELKILYDERNVYVAIRAYDDPKKIRRYVGRRDDFVGDIVGVCFDSYFDKRTGFEFDLTAGGSKIDLVASNDGFDHSWDAVWYGATALEADAWTAELQIPLNQLRYGSHDEQVWGLHAWRWIDRHQEEDQWNLIPRKNTGFMYNLGELHGIRGLRRFRHVELLPHVLGRLTAEPEVAGDPYRSGATAGSSVGLDAKLGLATDFTLDAAVNPDFGQVEADPSVMNLSAYETFYSEKRPFFFEGKNILSFDVGSDMLFYSRRIGHPPAYEPDLREGEFIERPTSTSILDALKVTGKTRGGLSLGVLQSFTTSEMASLSYAGAERRQRVEPFTGYSLARVQKDWNKGNTSLGAIVTSTHRFMGDAALEALSGDAITAGVDVTRYFKNREYVIAAKAIASRVTGSATAISALETNAVHYFQRPDADHVDVHPGATSLAGHGGSLHLQRGGSGRWTVREDLRWASPGLDLNDLGYLRQADTITNGFSVEYEETKPRGIFRRFEIDLGREDAWDFGGLHQSGLSYLELEAEFTNKWAASAAVRPGQGPVDTRLLRGGPAVRLSPFVCTSLGLNTDYSKPLAGFLTFHKHFIERSRSDLWDLNAEVRWRASNSLTLSSDLRYSRNVDDLQYVTTAEAGGGPRHILGRISQRTFSATLRLDLHLSPDLSIQYYGSPFISLGRFSDFKRVTTPLAEAYEDRFRRLGTGEIAYREMDNSYAVSEPDGPSRTSYSFSSPDFSFRQFRSNLVARWEYRPGSVLYVVWSQGRTSESDRWEESLGRNLEALWRSKGPDLFLVKLSYWFSL